MKLELHATQPVGNVDIIDAFDEDSPGMGVVVGDAWRLGVGLFVKGLRGGAVDEGSEDLHALDALACWRRHDWDGGRGLEECCGMELGLTVTEVGASRRGEETLKVYGARLRNVRRRKPANRGAISMPRGSAVGLLAQSQAFAAPVTAPLSELSQVD